MTAIFRNWHFMRIMRALIAGWAFFEAYRTGEWLLIMPGSLFAMQAIFDIGCCGSAGCGVPYEQHASEIRKDELVVEEVRAEKS
ncbi:MAG TPA: hypothetical protein PKL15_00515 [Saprospiraceae bacterium]|nr:hypothetical protein [Saprospiraceae bacterium]